MGGHPRLGPVSLLRHIARGDKARIVHVRVFGFGLEWGRGGHSVAFVEQLCGSSLVFVLGISGACACAVPPFEALTPKVALRQVHMQALGENMDMILQFVWGYSESGPIQTRRTSVIAGPLDQAVIVAKIKELCGGGWVDGEGRESLEISRTHSLDEEELAPVDMDLI